jgi:hypothetical protein
MSEVNTFQDISREEVEDQPARTSKSEKKKEMTSAKKAQWARCLQAKEQKRLEKKEPPSDQWMQKAEDMKETIKQEILASMKRPSKKKHASKKKKKSRVESASESESNSESDSEGDSSEDKEGSEESESDGTESDDSVVRPKKRAKKTRAKKPKKIKKLAKKVLDLLDKQRMREQARRPPPLTFI